MIDIVFRNGREIPEEYQKKLYDKAVKFAKGLRTVLNECCNDNVVHLGKFHIELQDNWIQGLNSKARFGMFVCYDKSVVRHVDFELCCGNLYLEEEMDFGTCCKRLLNIVQATAKFSSDEYHELLPIYTDMVY